MSILSDLLSQFGGLAGAAKIGQQGSGGQMGLLSMLGLGGDEQPQGMQAGTSQINPAFQSGALAQMGDRSSQPNWFDRNADAIKDISGKLGAWGAGVSKASEFSRTPIGFGTALAGGNDALQAYDKNQSDIAKAGNIDYNDEAQKLLEKQFSGTPLTPEEVARLQAINSFRQTIGGTQFDALGNPVARPSLLDGSGITPLPNQQGQQPPLTAPQGVAPQAPGGQQMRLPPNITPEKLAEYKRLRGMQ